MNGPLKRLINSKKSNDKTRKYLMAGQMGLNMAVGMAVFSGLGYWLDQKKGGQLWTLTGMFLGLFYCAYEAWKSIRLTSEDYDPKQDNSKRQPPKN